MAALKKIAALLTFGLVCTFSASGEAREKQGARKLEEGVFLGFLWPLRGISSSPYGARNDPLRPDTVAHHGGLDLVAPPGSWAAASKAGRVTFAGRAEGYGNLVTLRHPNDTETRYGHLASLQVQKGMFVRPGQPLGLVGSTGRSTGRHLHFEIRVKGRPVDPSLWLVPYGYMMPNAKGR